MAVPTNLTELDALLDGTFKIHPNVALLDPLKTQGRSARSNFKDLFRYSKNYTDNAITDLIGGASTEYNTLKKIEDIIEALPVVDTSLFIPLTQKAAANGVATLDADGFVPLSQIRTVNEIKVYANNTARLATTPTVVTKAFVIDDGDGKWAEYIYDPVSNTWTKTADEDTYGIVLDWANITNKPTTIAGFGITNAYTKTEVNDFLALKANTFTGINSVSYASNQIQLSGDVASPGNNKIYGTNGSGVRGWYDAPTGGSMTAEAIQDAAFSILGTEFTYDDAGNTVSINSIAQSKVTGLVTALANKQDKLAGTTLQLVRGDGSLVSLALASLLADVQITSPTVGQVLTYGSGGKWVNATPTGGTSVASDVLVYNPAATASGNTYASWSALYAAFLVKPGIVRILVVDEENGDAIPTITGTNDFENRAQLVGIGVNGKRAKVTTGASGATLNGLNYIEGIEFDRQGSGLFRFGWGTPATLQLRNVTADRLVFDNSVEVVAYGSTIALSDDRTEMSDPNATISYYCYNSCRLLVNTGDIEGTSGQLNVNYDGTTTFQGDSTATIAAFNTVITTTRTANFDLVALETSTGGGASNLSDLLDVNVETLGSAQNGYALAWNNALGKWTPQLISGGSSYSFSGEFTVAGSSVSVNSIAASKITGLATVATTGAYNDLTGKPTIPSTLAALTGDVSISSPATANQLRYVDSKWRNRPTFWLNPDDFFTGGVTFASATVAQKTAAFQAAINAAIAGDCGVHFVGTWDVNPLTASDGFVLHGFGRDASILRTTSNTQPCLKIESSLGSGNTRAAWLSSFTVAYNGGSTLPVDGSCGIYRSETVYGSLFDLIENVKVTEFWTGIHMHRCWNYEIRSCEFGRHRFAGIRNTNNYNGDAGDLYIHHCVFYSFDSSIAGHQTTTGAHVLINAAAGTYVHDNKFYGNFKQSVYYNFNTAATDLTPSVASIAHCHDNQFDHPQGFGALSAGGACFRFSSVWGTAQPGNALNCNRLQQILINDNHSNYGNLFFMDSLAGAFRELKISSNYVTRGGQITISNIADLTLTNNTFSATETLDSGGNAGPSKPVVLTGTITGRYRAKNNEYRYYASGPDIIDEMTFDTVNRRFGFNTYFPQALAEFRQDQATTNVATTTSLLLTNANATGLAAFGFTDGTNRVGGFQYNNTSPSQNIFACTYVDYPFYFGTNSLIRMTIGAGTNAGRIGMGTTSPASPLHVLNSLTSVANVAQYGVYSEMTVSPASSTTGTINNIHYSVLGQGVVSVGAGITANCVVGGGFAATNASTGTGTVRTAVGVFGHAGNNTPTAAVTNAVGVLSTVYSFTPLGTQTATVTNAYSAYVMSPKQYQGNITGTNLYGLYIDDFSAASGTDIRNNASYSTGTWTNRYALWVNGGRVVTKGLPVYADNAAATAAGLVVGEHYRTSTGQQMIVF